KSQCQICRKHTLLFQTDLIFTQRLPTADDTWIYSCDPVVSPQVTSFPVMSRGKQGQCVYQGLTMFDQAVWSPKPCVTCLCTGGRVVCDESTCPEIHCHFPFTPAGECCPVCMEPEPDLSLDISGDSPVPNDPSDVVTPLTQEEIQKILWREAEQHREEEERVKKKEEARRKRRKQRKEQEEKQRKIAEEMRKQEEEALRREEENERREEENERREEENERREEEKEEQEEEVWLRGDEEQVETKETEEGEDREIIDAKLTHFPPLAIPELKSLSLEGNSISRIPADAFNGIPNLEWINLKKNKLTSAGIDAKAFKGLKKLTRLYLDGNLLDVVPSDLPPTLQELKINENRLRGIDENSFQDLSSLVILELEGNLLSEGNVDPLAFAPLIQLSYLRLGRNHFRTVPQGLPKSLLELYLENNLIEEISETVFNQTSNLNIVSLRHNKLEETRIAPLAWINHRNLESIDLSYNKLYMVPSYLPRSLVHLVLLGNNIERIPGYVFAHMQPGLEYLYLSYNKLDGEGTEPESFFGAYHSLVELCLDHNQLVVVPSGINEMTNLHFLRLDNNMIRSIPDEAICDPNRSGDSTLVAVRLENNYIDPQKISPMAFSCVRSASSVVLKPQKTK
uniref:Extracellular matrix protein 2 n=1 Tax=Pundamilia nyererei TaxID=303518 RepID=A0A3B4H7K3_9CICH